MGVPPNHPFIDGFSLIFHEINHPFSDTSIYGKPLFVFINNLDARNYASRTSIATAPGPQKHKSCSSHHLKFLSQIEQT
jgi:hypothetical protein